MTGSLNVNTIEFNGQKAVINSYSEHPALVESMNKQLAAWTERYPNATVRMERMYEIECMKLIAESDKTHGRNHAYEIGLASMEGEGA